MWSEVMLDNITHHSTSDHNIKLWIIGPTCIRNETTIKVHVHKNYYGLAATMVTYANRGVYTCT